MKITQTDGEKAGRKSMLLTLLRYKQWANRITFGAVQSLPDEEVVKKRVTRFGNILHTLNHVFVIDEIFRCHLEGRSHGYSSRNTQTPLPLAALERQVALTDAWYLDCCTNLSPDQLDGIIEFEFVGGGAGAMSRAEIFLHVVNHGTYHRGFVSDMMYQVPSEPPANDLTVFLREELRM